MPQGLKKTSVKVKKVSHKPTKLRKGSRVIKSKRAHINEARKPHEMLSKAINKNIEQELVVKSGTKPFRLVKADGADKIKQRKSTGKLIKQVLKTGKVSA